MRLFDDCKPLRKTSCCDVEMRFRYSTDEESGEALVSCVCKKCGKGGTWYNIPECEELFWHNSAHDFASLYWKNWEFENALKHSFM